MKNTMYKFNKWRAHRRLTSLKLGLIRNILETFMLCLRSAVNTVWCAVNRSYGSSRLKVHSVIQKQTKMCCFFFNYVHLSNFAGGFKERKLPFMVYGVFSGSFLLYVGLIVF